MSKVAIKGADTGTGVFTLESPATNTDRTLTIPDQTGKVMATGGGAVNVSTSAADDSVVVDASGNLGLGVTPSAWDASLKAIDINTTGFIYGSGASLTIGENGYYDGTAWRYKTTSEASYYANIAGQHRWYIAPSGTAGDAITFNQAMTLTGDGNFMVGQTGATISQNGAYFSADGSGIARTDGVVLNVNRISTDGTVISIRQDGTQEGTIYVSGTTVSYNGGHLSRWAQTLTPKDESLVKGTVLSNLDEMNVYVDAHGNPVDNEQLNKVKVSDVEGDSNVAGVFVNWDYDEDHNVDEINMAMTGDMIIRIAAGTTVARGDLLMSAGDGTAKPQGDDIVRSKTIAKVTSTHVTCTYEDGSFCVPCVLMAC